jgi:hypothetical protein
LALLYFVDEEKMDSFERELAHERSVIEAKTSEIKELETNGIACIPLHSDSRALVNCFYAALYLL